MQIGKIIFKEAVTGKAFEEIGRKRADGRAKRFLMEGNANAVKGIPKKGKLRRNAGGNLAAEKRLANGPKRDDSENLASTGGRSDGQGRKMCRRRDGRDDANARISLFPLFIAKTHP